jgi:predicted nucleic acid-binding protein
LIVLDTNVVSALMHTSPDRMVLAWLDEQPAESIWITSITLFESKFGIGILPAGRRRRALEAAFEAVLNQDLGNRVLDFDAAAACEAAAIGAMRRAAGLPVDMRDTQIAGIVRSRRGRLATRNVRHFADLDFKVVNPWDTA